jgi:hypothetical protein
MNRRRDRPRIPISHRGARNVGAKHERIEQFERRERVEPERKRR